MNKDTLTIKLIKKLVQKGSSKTIKRALWVSSRFSGGKNLRQMSKTLHRDFSSNGVIRRQIEEIINTTNETCLDKFLETFIGNQNGKGYKVRKETEDNLNIHIPYVGLISPSMACNLRCEGCYAADYERNEGIGPEKLQELLDEMKELGIYWAIILGGEPFFNDYLLDIYEKNDDMFFMTFTNGTLFDAKLANRLARMGNVMPMFSLEGFEEKTDSRRGKGTYKAVTSGMRLLRERGVLFGVSSAVSRKNLYEVTSEAFIDEMITLGSKMNWFFMFMPVGESPIDEMNLMLTPEERIYLGRRTSCIRKIHPYFTIDFFNDAPYVNGCIAGREYFHVNASLDLEPCIFAHYSTDNLSKAPLLEGLASPFFSDLQNRQPYNPNLLMPCMMIDNPQVIRDLAAIHKARPTHKSAELMISHRGFMKKLDKLAKDFTSEAEEAFSNIRKRGVK